MGSPNTEADPVSAIKNKNHRYQGNRTYELYNERKNKALVVPMNQAKSYDLAKTIAKFAFTESSKLMMKRGSQVSLTGKNGGDVSIVITAPAPGPTQKISNRVATDTTPKEEREDDDYTTIFGVSCHDSEPLVQFCEACGIDHISFDSFKTTMTNLGFNMELENDKIVFSSERERVGEDAYKTASQRATGKPGKPALFSVFRDILCNRDQQR